MNDLRDDGLFDPDFGANGFVRLPGTGEDNLSSAVAPLSDGRLYVAYHSGENYAVARLMESGELDPSFGLEGVLTDRFPADREPIARRCSIYQIISVQDKVLLVGEVYFYYGPGDERIYPAMARYTSAGALDVDFCEGGFRLFIDALGRPNNSQAQAPTPFLGNGGGATVYVANTFYAMLNGDIRHDEGVSFASGAVLAFDIEGEVDKGFGIEGLALIKPTTFVTQLSCMCGSDEGLFLGGRLGSPDYTYRDSFVAKLTLEGVVDERFAIAGFCSLEEEHSPLGLFSGGENILIVAGFGTREGSNIGLQIALRTTDGTLHPTFNEGRKLVVAFDGTPIFGRLGAPVENGYLAIGRYDRNGPEVVVEKYFSDGSRDTGFAEQGLAFAGIDHMSDCARGEYSLAFDSVGSVLVVGFHGGRAQLTPVIARLLL